jgi:hypothetical protein
VHFCLDYFSGIILNQVHTLKHVVGSTGIVKIKSIAFGDSDLADNFLQILIGRLKSPIAIKYSQSRFGFKRS